MLTEPDKRDEETYAGSDGQDQGMGHNAGEPLPETEQRENEEDPARRGQITRRDKARHCFWSAVSTYPSMNTAAIASLYVMKPLPWNPTTEYAS